MGSLLGPAPQSAPAQQAMGESSPRTPERASSSKSGGLKLEGEPVAGSTPDSTQLRGFFAAQAELLKSMQTSQDAAETRHQVLVEHLSRAVTPAAPTLDEPRVDDKLNALTGIKFDQTLPVLKDSDVDFANHWRNFKSIIDCHAYGRKGGSASRYAHSLPQDFARGKHPLAHV